MSQYEEEDTVKRQIEVSSEVTNEKGFVAYVKRNKITVIIVVIILLIAIWYFFIRKKGTNTGSVTSSSNTGSASRSVASSGNTGSAASGTPGMVRLRVSNNGSVPRGSTGATAFH